MKVIHIQQHEHAAMQKMQAQKAAMDPNGGGQQQPGAPNGTPPGAQPMAPQGVQNPPGTIPTDQLHDPSAMPRRPG